MSRERLLKLLNLTASDSDGEAMNALRKAQKLMVELKIEWKDLVNGRVAQNIDIGFQQPQPRNQNFYAQAGFNSPEHMNDAFNVIFGMQGRQAQASAQKRKQHIDEIADILKKADVVMHSANVPEVTRNLVKQRIEIFKQGGNRLDGEFLEALNVAYGWAIGKPYREGASG